MYERQHNRSTTSNYVGAVRFPDGELRFISFSANAQMVRRRLYKSPRDVCDIQELEPMPRCIDDEEVVEVMPFFMHSSNDVLFKTRASRLTGMITGPCTLEEALRERLSDRFNEISSMRTALHS